MTETPELNPQPDEPREATSLDVASAAFDQLVLELVVLLREANPEAPPYAVACMMYRRVWQGLTTFMPGGAATVGLLFGFEQAHPEPMNFIQRNKALKALESFSNARREVEKRTDGGIIIPPGVDGGGDAD